MNTQYLVINEKKAVQRAEAYFFESCQVRANRIGTEQLHRAGLAALEKIRKHIQIKCAYIETTHFRLQGNHFYIEDTVMKCNAAEQLKAGEVQKIYLYIITSGEFRTESSRLTDQYYTDLWGTAYVQAARDILQSQIEKENRELYVMESFGPGYFGMPLQEISKFFKLINCTPIGVMYNESGLMVPIKSVAGIYAVLNKPAKINMDDCRSCIGDKSGCEFCSTKVKMKER